MGTQYTYKQRNKEKLLTINWRAQMAMTIVWMILNPVGWIAKMYKKNKKIMLYAYSWIKPEQNGI